MSYFSINRHSFFKLKYGTIVFTNMNKKCINQDMKKTLESYIQSLIEKANGQLISFSAEENYVKLIFELPPQEELASLMSNFKGNSSKMIRKNFSEHLSNFYKEDEKFWKRNYLVFTCQDNELETFISEYIEKQSEEEKED